MARALIGAISCARCGRQVTASVGRCPDCGLPVTLAASGAAIVHYTGLFADVAPSRPLRRVLAGALDLLPFMIIAGTGTVQLLTGLLGGRDLFPVTVAAAALMIIFQASVWIIRGRTYGRLVLQLRTVDNLTGLPVGVALDRRRMTADLSRGRDPLAGPYQPLPPEAFAHYEGDQDQLQPAEQAVKTKITTKSRSVQIVTDDGQWFIVITSLLIGRSPVDSTGQHPLLAWPDLRRSLAKTHALLEWNGSVLWITDLGSASSTVLVDPTSARRPLVPGIRGAAGIGWTVQCGHRSFEIRAGTSLAESEAPA